MSKTLPSHQCNIGHSLQLILVYCHMNDFCVIHTHVRTHNTHMYIHAHTQAHTYTHAQAYTRTHTRTHTSTRAHTHVCMCMMYTHAIAMLSCIHITLTDYSRDLEKDVMSETSGHFKRLLVSMLTVSTWLHIHTSIYVCACKFIGSTISSDFILMVCLI